MTSPTETDSAGENYSNNSWYLGYLSSNAAGGLTTPLIPLFITFYLGLNVFDVGITSAIASAASVPALIFWGLLSDRYKKRKVFILVGFMGGFISLLPMLYVHALMSYILVLIAFQVVSMASVPVSTMILIENSSEDKWPAVMGRFNFVASMGTVIGLAFGTVFIAFFANKSSELLVNIYMISAFIYLLSAIIIFLAIPEPNRTISRRKLSDIHSIRIIERIRFFPSTIIHFAGLREGRAPLGRDLKFYLFCTFLLMFAFQLFFVPYPVFAIEHLGASEVEIYIMYILNSGLGAFTYQYTGRINNRIGIRKSLAFALVTRIVIFSIFGAVSFIMFQSALWLIFALIVYGALGSLWSFIGIAETASVTLISPKARRGKTIGYYNSLNGAGQIFGGLLSGIISEYAGYSIDFLIAAVLVIVGTSLILKRTPSKMIKGSVTSAQA
ncbi:MAG: MFS transporter [Candidatus Thermoplasmatota archaeon]|nr:MFS transporter [Candidatus Thermoplasmatota archaeon]